MCKVCGFNKDSRVIDNPIVFFNYQDDGSVRCGSHQPEPHPQYLPSEEFQELTPEQRKYIAAFMIAESINLAQRMAFDEDIITLLNTAMARITQDQIGRMLAHLGIEDAVVIDTDEVAFQIVGQAFGPPADPRVN